MRSDYDGELAAKPTRPSKTNPAPKPSANLKPTKERHKRLPGEPELVPHFPVKAFARFDVTKDANGAYKLVPPQCPHRGRYRKGSSLVCMVCHQSGMDHLGALQRTIRTEPKPAAPAETKPRDLTRKERRAMKRDYEPRFRAGSLSPAELHDLASLGVTFDAE